MLSKMQRRDYLALAERNDDVSSDVAIDLLAHIEGLEKKVASIRNTCKSARAFANPPHVIVEICDEILGKER